METVFTHEITVARPLAEAMPLFTPKGEEDWVPGWQPSYQSPDTGETMEEMIFTTGEGDETTLWTCLKWQPEQGHARYLRFTPASRVAVVDVRCRDDGNGGTRVRVSYHIHPLTQAGHTYVDDLSPAKFADQIDHWADLIANLDG